MNVLFGGCGDIALRTAQILAETGSGGRRWGIIRRPEAAAGLEAAGVEPLVLDLDAPGPALAPMLNSEAPLCLLYTAPPPRAGDTDPRLAGLLQALAAPGLARLVYISTSAVYGDCQGAWVDESAELQLTIDRTRRRADAEQQIRALAAARGLPWVILRTPGIYGPGRLPLDRLERGEPIVHPDEAPYTNMIHADDLARICALALTRGEGIYNISDGHPIKNTDYYRAVSEATGLPMPPYISMAEAQRTFSPMRLSFLNASRRLKTERMVAPFGEAIHYPELSEGVKASLSRG